MSNLGNENIAREVMDAIPALRSRNLIQGKECQWENQNRSRSILVLPVQRRDDPTQQKKTKNLGNSVVSTFPSRMKRRRPIQEASDLSPDEDDSHTNRSNDGIECLILLFDM